MYSGQFSHGAIVLIMLSNIDLVLNCVSGRINQQSCTVQEYRMH